MKRFTGNNEGGSCGRIQTLSILRRALDGLSGGTHADFAGIDWYLGQPGETIDKDREDWTSGILAGECLTIWNQADGAGGILRRDFAWGSLVPLQGQVLWRHGSVGARQTYVQAHEFGHALGVSHTFSDTPSIMSYSGAGYSNDVTGFDRAAGRLMYQRSPVNRSPDVDPAGLVINGPAFGFGAGSDRVGDGSPGPGSSFDGLTGRERWRSEHSVRQRLSR